MASILISGASSGFGALTARALAADGHDVHTGMRDLQGHNREAAAQARHDTATLAGKLLPVELDVLDQASVDDAVAHVIDQHGHIDALIHNAGHMVTGPAEAASPTFIPRCAIFHPSVWVV